MRRKSDISSEQKFFWQSKIHNPHSSMICAIEVLMISEKEHENIMRRAFPDYPVCSGFEVVHNREPFRSSAHHVEEEILEYNRILITGSIDNSIRIWNLRNFALLFTLEKVHKYYLEKFIVINLTENEQRQLKISLPYLLVSVCKSCEVNFWDIGQGMKIVANYRNIEYRSGLKTVEYFRSGKNQNAIICLVQSGGSTAFINLKGEIIHKIQDSRESHTLKIFQINTKKYLLMAGHLGVNLFSWKNKKMIKKINSSGINFIFCVDVLRIKDCEFAAIEKYSYSGEKRIGFILKKHSALCSLGGIKVLKTNTVLIALAGNNKRGEYWNGIIITELFSGQIIIRVPEAHSSFITSICFAYTLDTEEQREDVDASILLLSGSFDGKLRKWNLLSMSDHLYCESLNLHCMIESSNCIKSFVEIKGDRAQQTLYALMSSTKNDLILSRLE